MFLNFFSVQKVGAAIPNTLKRKKGDGAGTADSCMNQKSPVKAMPARSK
jgi:hypothetical protein